MSQKIDVGALTDLRLKVHHILGYRCLRKLSVATQTYPTFADDHHRNCPSAKAPVDSARPSSFATADLDQGSLLFFCSHVADINKARGDTLN